MRTNVNAKGSGIAAVSASMCAVCQVRCQAAMATEAATAIRPIATGVA